MTMPRRRTVIVLLSLSTSVQVNKHGHGSVVAHSFNVQWQATYHANYLILSLHEYYDSCIAVV